MFNSAAAGLLSPVPGSGALKIAVPATKTLAPALTTRGAVSRSIPPSTSMSKLPLRKLSDWLHLQSSVRLLTSLSTKTGIDRRDQNPID